MQNTRLGISAGILGAGIFLAVYFGGILPGVVLAGYVLLFEQNTWLRKSAVKALALYLAIHLIYALVGLIPDAFDVISSFVYIFKVNFSVDVLSRIVGFINSVIGFVETILFLGLALKALNQGTIPVPGIDGFINKHVA